MHENSVQLCVYEKPKRRIRFACANILALKHTYTRHTSSLQHIYDQRTEFPFGACINMFGCITQKSVQKIMKKKTLKHKFCKRAGVSFTRVDTACVCVCVAWTKRELRMCRVKRYDGYAPRQYL